MLCSLPLLIQTVLLKDDSPTFSENQLDCMERLICRAPDMQLSSRLKKLQLHPHNADNTNDVCAWRFVDCVNGAVTSIEWEYAEGAKCDISWFPPSVERIYFEEVTSTGLDTRFLPKALKLCWLIQCGLQGTIDMTTLPDALEIFNLPDNFLSGTIRLVRLPVTIRQISFLNNRIKKVVVLNSALPEKFRNAGFSCQKKPKIVCMDGKKADSRVNTLRDHPYNDSSDSYTSDISSEVSLWTMTESYTETES